MLTEKRNLRDSVYGREITEGKISKENPGRSRFEEALKTISKQSSIVFVGLLSFQFVAFFSSILLARILGPDLLGRYHLGLIIIQILSIVSIMGFDRSFVRFIPVFNLDDKGKTKKLLKNNISVALLLSTGLGVLLFFFSPFLAAKLFHSSDMGQVLRIFSFFLPIATVFNLGLASLRGFKRADLRSYVENFVVPITFVILLIAVLLAHGKVSEVIIVRIISQLMGVGCIIYFLLRNFSAVFESQERPFELRGYLSYSFPFLIISLLYFAMTKINILMLGYFLKADQVGIYAVLVNIAGVSVFGLQAVNTIFAPHISELYENSDFENLERLLKILTKWIFYFSLFIFALILIFKIELLKIYGTSFTAGSRALVVLALGQLVNGFAGSTGAILLMTGRQKWEVLNSICVLFLNIVINLILIPRFGIEGAAIASALSLSTINVLKLLETYKEFKFHPYSVRYFKGTLSITIGALVSFLFYYYVNLFNLNFIVVLAFGISLLFIVSISFFYFLKFDEEDKIILDKVSHKFKLRVRGT